MRSRHKASYAEGSLSAACKQISISGEKPAKLNIGIHVALHRNLLACADVRHVRPGLPRRSGAVIVPMREHFISDRSLTGVVDRILPIVSDGLDEAISSTSSEAALVAYGLAVRARCGRETGVEGA
jgi:hypothetical protein